MKNLEVVKRYLDLVEKMDLREDTALGLLHDDYCHHELPNLMNKQGQKSNKLESFKRILTAKGLLDNQRYQINHVVEQGDTVVVEALWVGTVGVDAGHYRKGSMMKAHFCMIFVLKDGLIHTVRNYDCFESL